MKNTILALLMVLLAGCNYTRKKGELRESGVESPKPPPSSEKTPPGSDETVTYASLYTKVFYPKCIRCHLGSKPAGDVTFASYTALMDSTAGTSGLPAITPGNKEESAVWIQMSGKNMPPPNAGSVTAEELKSVETWISNGARNG